MIDYINITIRIKCRSGLVLSTRDLKSMAGSRVQASSSTQMEWFTKATLTKGSSTGMAPSSTRMEGGTLQSGTRESY